MATEAKMGMAIIVILVAAFGFLVYHKFDLRQRQLLAANMKGSSVEDEEENLQKAVAEQSQVFNEFNTSATDSLPSVTPAENLTVDDAGNRTLPQPGTTTAFPGSDTDRLMAANVSAQTVDVGTPEPVFGGLAEPDVEPTSFHTTKSQQEIPPVDFNIQQPREVEDPFATLTTSEAPRTALPSTESTADQPDPETFPEPSPFPTAESLPRDTAVASLDSARTPLPEASVDPFQAFDSGQSTEIQPEPPVFGQVAGAPDEQTLDTNSDGRFTRDFDRSEERQPIDEQEAPAFTRTEVAADQMPRTLPYASLEDNDDLTPATSVSQSNPFVAKAKRPAATQPDLFPDFPVKDPAGGPLAPVSETNSESVADLQPVSEIPLLTDTSADDAIRQFNSQSDPTEPTPNPFAEPKQDLRNAIAMLEPNPDVNLFEDPIQRDAKPPRTFPEAAEPQLPVAEEPSMPTFPGLDNKTRTFSPQPTMESFPTANEPPEPLTPPSETNLFPQTTEPAQRMTQTEPTPYVPEPRDSSAFVPQPREPAFAEPTPSAPLDLTPLPTRPYEPEEAKPQSQQWGPDVGVAHILKADDILLTSGSGSECEICEVRPKDNYWTISKRAYGTARYFSSLALYNKERIPDPKKLRPGMKVLVPDPKVLEKKYPEFFAKAKPTTRTRPTGYFITADGNPAYRVGERVTLSEIAHKHLGRASRWIQIYQMNRQTLRDPNKLKPGTVISLPDDATNVQLTP